MLSIRYILLSFFRREKCLEFGFTLLTQSEQPFNRTGLLMRAFLVNLKSDLSGVHFRKFKEEFFDDVISILMMSTEVIEGE